MFMVSVRLSRIKLVACVLAVVLVVSVGVVGMKKSKKSSGEVTASASAAQVGQEQDQTVKVRKIPAKTNEQRMEFIASFGWEAEVEPVEILEVIIPQEFDSVYEDYNSIQKKQGLDLSGYAGKRVKKYTYTITNYPGDVESVQMNMLVYKNKIIGGDICSLAEDGFMHGFSAPA